MTEGGVLLVRHGQSTWNAESRWQGQADPPLSALGEHQARAAAEQVAHLAPTRIVSSDLERSRRTAELLAPRGVEIATDAAWRERHAGEWTGLTRAEIEDAYPGYLDARRSPPGFEADEPLLARALPALETLVRELVGTGDAGPGHDGTGAGGGCVLVVTHGGLIGTLERHFGAPHVRVPNLGGRWFHARGGAATLGERDVLVDAEAITIPGQI